MYAIQGDMDTAWALAYTLTGHNTRYHGTIEHNGHILSPKDLKQQVHNLHHIPWYDKTRLPWKPSGYDRLHDACRQHQRDDVEEIIAMFGLDHLGGDRFERPIAWMGNAGIQVNAAIGYAMKKSLFVTRYIKPSYLDTLHVRLGWIKDVLIAHNQIILLPTQDATPYLGTLIDQVIPVHS